jgi:hypothetical protein
LVVRGLTRGAKNRLALLALADPSVTEEQLAEWAFDPARVPLDKQQLLRQYHADPNAQEADEQDWIIAAEHSRYVTESSPELAWAWDILGYVAERQEDVEGAIDAYRHAAACSAFTDQSIRLQTHWTSDQSAKFSVARLQKIRPSIIAESTYYQLLCDSDVHRRRLNVTDYWMQQASRFAQAADPASAHRSCFAAAWDIGADSITAYADLLDSISQTAEQAHQTGRAELARTHRRCLRDRYGL